MAPTQGSGVGPGIGGGGGGGRESGGRKRGYAFMLLLFCAALSLIALRRSTGNMAMELDAAAGAAPGLSRGYAALEAEAVDARLKGSRPPAARTELQHARSELQHAGQHQEEPEVERLKRRVEALLAEKSKAVVEVELLSGLFRRNVTELHQQYRAAIWEKDQELETLRQKLSVLETQLTEAASQPRQPDKSEATELPLSALPSWTEGFRFYILGAVLTRDQHDNRLYADTVVMGRKLFDGSMASHTGVEGLDWRWEKGKVANSKNPSDLVKHAGASFYCDIPGVGQVEAELVPTATTIDGNVNDIQEIIRCGVPDDYRADVPVTLVLREGPLCGARTTPLIRYTLPWKQRTTGYLAYRPESSTLDPWSTDMHDIHLCVPGTRSTFSCPITDLLIEFVEYHVGVMRVDHIHLGVDYKWGSKDMDTLLKVMRGYIDEGKVSVSSYDVMDGTGTVGSEMKKVYHMNQCLLYSKGLSRYVGIWDTDEMLIPRDPPAASIAEVIKEQVSRGPWSDDDLCYLLLTSYGHQQPKKELPAEQLWVGHLFKDTREDEYDHTWQKSILSNRNIYYTGYHLPGACHADRRKWTDTVMYEDAIRVEPSRAAMFHYRNKLSRSAPFFRSERTEPSEYATLYFPKVLEGIKRRGLDAMVEEVCGVRPFMEAVAR